MTVLAKRVGRSVLLFGLDLLFIYAVWMAVIVAIWLLLLHVSDEQQCRRGWDDISEYSVLVAICANDETRVNLMWAETENRIARETK